MSAPSPPRFRPLRRPTSARRALAYVLGPFSWVIALVVLAVLLERQDSVELALAVLGGSFAAGLVVHGLARLDRAREERRG